MEEPLSQEVLLKGDIKYDRWSTYWIGTWKCYC